MELWEGTSRENERKLTCELGIGIWNGLKFGKLGENGANHLRGETAQGSHNQQIWLLGEGKKMNQVPTQRIKGGGDAKPKPNGERRGLYDRWNANRLAMQIFLFF
jgi:hypothetical protein